MAGSWGYLARSCSETTSLFYHYFDKYLSKRNKSVVIRYSSLLHYTPTLLPTTLHLSLHPCTSPYTPTPLPTPYTFPFTPTPLPTLLHLSLHHYTSPLHSHISPLHPQHLSPTTAHANSEWLRFALCISITNMYVDHTYTLLLTLLQDTQLFTLPSSLFSCYLFIKKELGSLENTLTSFKGYLIYVSKPYTFIYSFLSFLANIISLYSFQFPNSFLDTFICLSK